MGRVIPIFFAVLLLAAGVPGPAMAKRVALVIGNSAYEFVAPLKNPRNDALAISGVLEKLGFEVITGTDLTRTQLERTARDFAIAARGAEVALFYYAGHGLQVGGQNYLAPIDAQLADEADLAFEMVRLDDVLAQMEREKRTNLVFLDACRDNPLARNLARSMGTRSASIGRGLAKVDGGIGTLIAFATQPGNVALDGDGDNSPFTTAMLRHIETPGIEIEALMRRVRVDVISATGERQVPWSNSSLTGRFAFLEGGAPAQEAAPAPRDDARVAALQRQVDELRKRLEQTPEPAPKPSKDEGLAALQKEMEALRKRLEETPPASPGDGIALVLRKDLGVNSALELSGAAICFGSVPGVEEKVANYFRDYRMEHAAVRFDTFEQASAAFDAGRCDVLPVRGGLAEAEVRKLTSPRDMLILPERL